MCLCGYLQKGLEKHRIMCSELPAIPNSIVLSLEASKNDGFSRFREAFRKQFLHINLKFSEIISRSFYTILMSFYYLEYHYFYYS